MPLPLPNLDTRRWSDLVDEGRALVPRYDSDWTDHNVHDPGITLMELFAWLTEMNIYRLNQVPPRHILKFLELAGYPPRPPRSARTMLTFTPASGATFTLPGGAQFTSASGALYRTLRDLAVSVAPLAAVLIDAGDGAPPRDRTAEWLEGIPVPMFGAAIYLGFESLPAGGTLAIGFRVSACLNGEDERRRILCEAALQERLCRASIPDTSCNGQPPAAKPAELKHHSVVLAWEAFTGSFTRVTPVSDDTRALTLDGIVEVPVPAAVAPSTQGQVVKPLFYLRVRVVSGAYDKLPQLLDVAPNSVWAAQSVPVTATFPIEAGAVVTGAVPAAGSAAGLDLTLDVPGVVQALAFLPAASPGRPDIKVLDYQPPTALARGSVTVSMGRAGASLGTPDQLMYLPGAPVEQHSISLYTHLDGEWQPWRRREDLDASTRADFDYVLDPTTGSVSFGDGEQGIVPPLGSSVLAVYRSTLADGGNVAAPAVFQVTDSAWNHLLLSHEVQASLGNIVTTRGALGAAGTAAEDLDGAAGRAVEVLHAHERLVELAGLYQSTTLDQLNPALVRAIHEPTRAVNLLDIERLALNVPGTCVARAHAWAGLDANYPCLRASGVVTVMIVPDLDTPKPVPSTGLIRAVQRYLDARRILCTRIVVAAPDYLTVRVSARVALARGASGARVAAAVTQELNLFLDPRAGGPNGFGWPFGRDVYRSEILNVIQSVPGVDHVLALSTQADRGAPQCGNLTVCATWLTTPGQHRIETI